jgi:hypothetical protein
MISPMLLQQLSFVRKYISDSCETDTLAAWDDFLEKLKRDTANREGKKSERTILASSGTKS